MAALRFDPSVLLAAQGSGAGGRIGLRVAFFDVDGVLTDGSLWIGAEGESVKPFNSLDGHGLKLLAQAGITPVIITGRDSAAVRRRVADLGLQEAHYGAADKHVVAEAVLSRLGVSWDDAAAMGDDWPDLPLLKQAGFACAPANAHAEVQAVAHHVTTARGGHGAVRECCDLLLQACGAYERLLGGHLLTLDGR